MATLVFNYFSAPTNQFIKIFIMKRFYYFLVFFGLGSATVKANVTPNALFSDNAVFQRNEVVPVWGTAEKGEKVSVEFAGQKVNTVAANGQWMIQLKPLKAGGPYELTIKGNNTVTFINILVGEVWICSGQSNMERQLGLRSPQKPILNWEGEVAAANYNQIREFTVGRNPSSIPVKDLTGQWVICDSKTVKSFTAIGYFFGSELYKKLKVPIGLINSSWGGTAAEKWTSRHAMEANPQLKSLVEAYDKAVNNFPDSLQKYKKNESALLVKWAADTVSEKLKNKGIPRKPSAPIDPQKTGDCGGLFNGMIYPLIPYAIKGVIWYQGETNSGRAKQYNILFPSLISDWRSSWAIGNFPFLFVQLAPYRGNSADLREAQLLTWKKTPNTSMVVTLDCGDSNDVHPANKRPVGERLALAARALAYGEKKLEYSGPVYESFKIEQDKVVIYFTHTGGGLVAKDGLLKGFKISYDNKKFFDAKAEIKGNTIIVYDNDSKTPKAVRYAYDSYASGNLFNQEGLPASPFRTDTD